ncbi:MAG TPA: LysE family transporter [Kofleriaceae bacterium]|nr:LysE family transporter [Kofleriaceae bacterium]
MFFAIGVAAGALTGVPIGPVNVAVIDAAYRHTLRRAIAVGLGGAIADCLYAALGVLGVTPILKTYPSVPPILYAVSGIVLLVYGFLTARSQPVAPATNDPPASESVAMRREMWSGFTVGLALIILNPAAIVTWVVIMGSIIPDGTRVEGIACAIGVMLGSFGWFSLVAFLTQKGKHVLGDKAAWIPRVVGIALMVYAAYLITKAVRFVIA